MAERQWTKPQWDAISADGGSLLVSAAAGSGKTAVLVERAVRLISEGENPVPADRLLVMTFSNAAAAEMKERMGKRLSKMISENPSNTFLQKQQTLLQSAQISTIHSFCLELIRQNFHELDVSPDFTLADENEMRMLEEDCARECIEELYAQEDNQGFLQLVELLASGRDDSRLIETILRIYHFSRSHPFFESWLDEKRGMYTGELPVGETVWGKTILRHVVDTLEYCRQMMRRGIEEITGDAVLEKAYLAPFQSDLSQIEQCLAEAKANNWDGAVNCLQSFQFEKLGSVRGGGAEKERAKSLRDRSKKIITDLASKQMNATSEDFRADILDLRPKIEVLFHLVKMFGQKLWEAKGDKKCLDFSDLEHLALQLLVVKEGDTWSRTAKAEEIAAQFSIVMVDEYQDTNEVQDMIFTSVSDHQKNLFMVGDVKQSIYSFRQAMPEIFLNKKRVFFPYKTGQFPAKIVLDTNFRSRMEVTEGINYLFRQLMSEQIGELEYDEEESLKCGASYPEYCGAQPELLLLEKPDTGDEDASLLEAQSVAERIADLLDQGYQVADGQEMRAVLPGDICILLRSHKNRAETYVQALQKRGIPASAEVGGGYLQTREVAMITSLLKALDNPLLDIELVAALLSPLFSFSDDDVARIRLLRRGEPFYLAVKAAAEEGDLKCAQFLSLFQKLRIQAATLPADKLLLHLYEETDAIAIAQGMKLGDIRSANLRLLLEYAASYHKLGYKKLGGFVGFLNRLEERGGDLAPAGGADGAANAVRVMSIHKSKGLEFPVVFLCDTFRQFNKVDLRSSTLLHSRFGFACVRREERTLRQFATVPMQAIRLESERSMLSEELRILYVALTRAKEKLIISGYSKRDLGKKLSGLVCERKGHQLPSYGVREANCYADWILMSLLHHASAGPLREKGGCDLDSLVDDGNGWLVQIQPAVATTGEVREEEALRRTARPDPALLEHLQRVTAYKYLYSAHTKIPTKLAVSAVAKGEASLAYRFSARPKFLQGTKLTGAEKGNAMHKFMQFSDYQKAREDIEEEIMRMGRQGFLTATEVESLQKGRLAKFFASALARRIFASKTVFRELKFTAECGKEVLGGAIADMDDEARVVLQGVADCVFIENGGAVIVDYKTDRVQSADELADRYREQLRLYRQILSTRLGFPVTQCLLYSFHLGREVEIF